MAFNVGLDVLDAEVESANGVATHLSSYMTYMLCRELGSSISSISHMDDREVTNTPTNKPMTWCLLGALC